VDWGAFYPPAAGIRVKPGPGAKKHHIGYIGCIGHIGVHIMLFLDMTQFKVVKGKRLGSVLVKQFSRAQLGVRCIRCIRCGVSSHPTGACSIAKRRGLAWLGSKRCALLSKRLLNGPHTACLLLGETQWHSGQRTGFRAERSGVHVPAMPLFHWVTTLGKLFTHVASPVFSAPRKWSTKDSIRTGPI